jgi:hypothetical protein
MPLAGRSAALRATSVTPTSSTNVATTATTGLAGNVQVSSTAQRHLDPDGTHALYRIAAGSTTLESSTKYTVNYVQGKFEYKADQTVSTGTYQADIEYLTATSIAGGREWQVNIEADMFEVSEFGSAGWKEYLPNLNGATVTINRYWEDSTFFDYLTLDTKFLVELVVNSANGWKYESYARVQSDQINTSVDAIVGETINLQVDGQLYFTT